MKELPDIRRTHNDIPIVEPMIPHPSGLLDHNEFHVGITMDCQSNPQNFRNTDLVKTNDSLSHFLFPVLVMIYLHKTIILVMILQMFTTGYSMSQYDGYKAYI